MDDVEEGRVDGEIRSIRDALTERMDAITVAVVRGIRADIPFYATGDVVSDRLLTDTVRENLQYMVNAMVASSFDTAPAAITGRSRAEMGVPLAAVMHAYRVGVARVWQERSPISRRRGRS